MAKDIKSWLTELGLRVLGPRVAAGLLVALIGLLLDAGLLGGETAQALVDLLR